MLVQFSTAVVGLSVLVYTISSVIPSAYSVAQLRLYSASVSTPPTLLDESFEKWLHNLTSLWGMKGLSVAVVRKTKDGMWNVETKGYGVKNAAGDAVTDMTRFAACSNSKLFTSLALGTLIESGAKIRPNSSVPLEWSTKIATILGDDWQLQDKVAEKHANLIDILTHRTGLPRHDLGYRKNLTTREAVQQLRYLRPSAGFREMWQYNNWMYMIAAEIIERVTGRSYQDYVHEMIGRLPMPSTTFNGTAAMLSGDLASGFVRVRANVSDGSGIGPFKYEYRPVDFFINDERHDLLAGAAGISMNAKDTATWLQTLLLWGKHPETGEQVIPEAAVKRAASGVSVVEGLATKPELSVRTSGLGQWSYAYRGHNIIEHTGGWRGWLSVISRAPQDDAAVAVFTNWDEGDRVMGMVQYYLYEKIFGLPHVDWGSRYYERLNLTETLATKPTELVQAPSAALLKSLSGLYSHPAYGDYLLCPPPADTKDSLAGCAQADAYYHAVVKAGVALSPTPPAFSIALAADLYNYIQLVPTSESSTAFKIAYFEVTTTLSYTGTREQIEEVVYPNFEGIDGNDSIEFGFDKDGQVQGFAMFGVWGPGHGVGRLEGATVKDRAEIWFERVH